MSYTQDKNEYYERINKNNWRDLKTGNIYNSLELEYNTNSFTKCLVPGLESHFKNEIKEINRILTIEKIIKKNILRHSFKSLKETI
jgi:hypothetical protein